MIKVAELRIGNLINHKIEGITKVDVMSYSGNEDDRVNDFALKFYEGIPLTEEWLLKFGFEIPKDGLFGKQNYFYKEEDTGNGIDTTRIHYNSKGKFFYEHSIVEIQYVHQLQNLYFALTGEELTLNSQPIKK